MDRPVANLLVIDDRILRSLMADIRFTALLPCLASAKRYLETEPAKCGRCHKKQASAIRNGMNQARACLTGLPANKRTELKTLLNARQLRVMKRDPAGRTRVVTF